MAEYNALDVALDYLTFNPTHYLFPLRPGTKDVPMVKDMLGSNASNNLDQIREWVRVLGNVNWGLALDKSGMVVADVDTKPGKVGAKTFVLLSVGYGWPDTLKVRTPSGGFHYYYRGRHEFVLGNNKHGIGEDIDSPHYVVLPGGRMKGGEYVIVDDLPVADCPAWLQKKLDLAREAKGERVAVTGSNAVPEVELDKRAAERWAVDFLSDEALIAVEGKNGNTTVYKVACELRGKGISETLAFELMVKHYNPRCEPPWQLGDCAPKDDLHTPIRNAYRYANREAPGGSTAEAHFADEPAPPIADVAKWFAGMAKDGPGSTKRKAAAAGAVQDSLADYGSIAGDPSIAPDDDDDPTKGPRRKPPGPNTYHGEPVSPRPTIERTRGNRSRLQLCEEWVYITTLERFVCRADPNMIYTVSAFDRAFSYARPSKNSVSKTLSRWMLDDVTTIRRSTRLVYEPGQPEFLDDGASYNLYMPGTIAPVAGDTSLWNSHLTYLFPDKTDRDHVLNWCAWLLQHVDAKPKHALIVQGEVQGTGKTIIAEVVSALLGPENVSNVSQHDLSGNFNRWAMNAKMILIEELRGIEKTQIKNTLHPMITQTRIMINDKNEKQFQIDNCFGFFLMTNDDVPVAIDPTDRRYLIARTPLKEEDKQTPEYYAQFYGTNNVGGLVRDPVALGAIYHELLNRDLAGYSAESSAPDTEAKRDVIEASRSPLEHWMLENQGEWPLNGRVIALSDVITALPRRLENTPRLDYSVAASLKKHFKGRKLGQFRLSKKNRDRVYLWAIRGSAIALAEEHTIAAIYLQDRAAGGNSGSDSDAASEFTES